jgi:hypothetical protein
VGGWCSVLDGCSAQQLADWPFHTRRRTPCLQCSLNARCGTHGDCGLRCRPRAVARNAVRTTAFDPRLPGPCLHPCKSPYILRSLPAFAAAACRQRSHDTFGRSRHASCRPLLVPQRQPARHAATASGRSWRALMPARASASCDPRTAQEDTQTIQPSDASSNSTTTPYSRVPTRVPRDPCPRYAHLVDEVGPGAGLIEVGKVGL